MGERERFEAAIASNPDDDAAYLVYADWLQQRGDPRGELIVLQQRGKENSAWSLLQRHEAYFYGGLSKRRGLLDATWRSGFLRSCRFSLDDDRGPGHEQRALSALEELLALHSARFLRELAIGVMNIPYNNLQAAIDVIGRHDLPTLDRLALGEGIEHSTAKATNAFTTELGRVKSLFAVAPNLRTLILRSTDDDPDIGGLSLSSLTELRISSVGGPELLHVLSHAALPELVTLELIGSFVEDPSAWNLLLSAGRFPKLRHLGFGVHSFLLGRMGALIANAPVLRQLRTLDVWSPLLVSDVHAILAGAGAFAHLERLRFRGALLFEVDPQIETALRGLCANVEIAFSMPH